MIADQSGNGRYVDDGTAPGVPHLGDGVLCSQKDTLGVDSHHLVPKLTAHFFDPLGPVDASVVHQYVQFTEPADRSLNRSLPLDFSGNVQGDKEALAPSLVYLGFGAAAFLLQHVAYHDFRAFDREEFGLNSAHSPGASADQSNLIFQPHSCFSSEQTRHSGRQFNRGWPVNQTMPRYGSD